MTKPFGVSSGPQEKAGLLSDLLQTGRLAVKLMMDARVATVTKLLIPGLMGLYILSPIDIVPDWFLGLGQLDDLAVLVLAVRLFIELCPPHVVAEHRSGITSASPDSAAKATDQGEVIDADYRVVD